MDDIEGGWTLDGVQPQNEDKGGARMRILVPIFFLYDFSSQ